LKKKATFSSIIEYIYKRFGSFIKREDIVIQDSNGKDWTFEDNVKILKHIKEIKRKEKKTKEEKKEIIYYHLHFYIKHIEDIDDEIIIEEEESSESIFDDKKPLHDLIIDIYIAISEIKKISDFEKKKKIIRWIKKIVKKFEIDFVSKKYKRSDELKILLERYFSSLGILDLEDVRIEEQIKIIFKIGKEIIKFINENGKTHTRSTSGLTSSGDKKRKKKIKGYSNQ